MCANAAECYITGYLHLLVINGRIVLPTCVNALCNMVDREEFRSLEYIIFNVGPLLPFENFMSILVSPG